MNRTSKTGAHKAKTFSSAQLEGQQFGSGLRPHLSTSTIRPNSYPTLGSRYSRSASPRMFSAVTITNSPSPGTVEYHHWSSR